MESPTAKKKLYLVLLLLLVAASAFPQKSKTVYIFIDAIYSDSSASVDKTPVYLYSRPVMEIKEDKVNTDQLLSKFKESVGKEFNGGKFSSNVVRIGESVDELNNSLTRSIDKFKGRKYRIVQVEMPALTNE